MAATTTTSARRVSVPPELRRILDPVADDCLSANWGKLQFLIRRRAARLAALRQWSPQWHSDVLERALSFSFVAFRRCYARQVILQADELKTGGALDESKIVSSAANSAVLSASSELARAEQAKRELPQTEPIGELDLPEEEQVETRRAWEVADIVARIPDNEPELIQAVCLIASGLSIRETAKQLNIPQTSLARKLRGVRELLPDWRYCDDNETIEELEERETRKRLRSLIELRRQAFEMRRRAAERARLAEKWGYEFSGRAASLAVEPHHCLHAPRPFDFERCRARELETVPILDCTLKCPPAHRFRFVRLQTANYGQYPTAQTVELADDSAIECAADDSRKSIKGIQEFHDDIRYRAAELRIEARILARRAERAE